MVLLGRGPECAALDQLLGAVRAGRSGALVVRGRPGVGKTALLEYAVEQAEGCRVVGASGVESEMELAFGALHQLCAPLLDRRDALPDPQRDALAVAFGLKGGTPPDRLFVGSPCSACCPKRPRTGHCCVWSTTRSGSIASRRRRWPSRPGAWRRTQSA